MKKTRFTIIIMIFFPYFLMAQNVKISGSISTNYSFPTINDFTDGLTEDDFSYLNNPDTASYFGGGIFINSGDIFNQKRAMIGKMGFDANLNFHFKHNRKLRWRTGIELSFQRAIENIQTEEPIVSYTFIDTVRLSSISIEEKEVNRDIRLWSLSMPINLEHSFFNNRFVLFWGVNLTAIMNQKDPSDDEWVEPWPSNPDYRLKLNYFTWKLNLGCEYNLGKNIYLRANYNHGMRNVFGGEYNSASGSSLYQNRKSHWRLFSLGMTYLFF